MYPWPISREATVWSRTLLPINFSLQYSAPFSGKRPCVGHPCQKQPSTNTASLAFLKRTSGRPSTPFDCFRGRSPTSKRARRSASSGFVPVDFTRPINSDLWLFDKTSMPQEYACAPARQDVAIRLPTAWPSTMGLALAHGIARQSRLFGNVRFGDASFPISQPYLKKPLCLPRKHPYLFDSCDFRQLRQKRMPYPAFPTNCSASNATSTDTEISGWHPGCFERGASIMGSHRLHGLLGHDAHAVA